MKFISVLIILLGFTYISNANNTKDWKINMQNMRIEVIRLSPFLYSESEFAKKSNREKIETRIANLEKYSTSLDKKVSGPAGKLDPSYKYIVENLKEDIKIGKKAYSKENLSFARASLKSAVNRCFQCHTQSYKKSQWSTKHSKSPSSWLSPEERISYLMALRNFKTAKEIMKNSLENFEEKSDRGFEGENTLGQFVLVSLRLEEDRKDTLETLNHFLKKQKMDTPLHRQTMAFIKSLKESPEISALNSLDKVSDLLSKADSKKEFRTDRVAYVESVLASSSVHKMIEEKKLKPTELGKAYYLLGQSYQNMNEPAFWDMHENYYAACIRTKPEKSLAKKCFKEFKDSLIFRNTGSSGTNLDLRDRFRLKELEKLSL